MKIIGAAFVIVLLAGTAHARSYGPAPTGSDGRWSMNTVERTAARHKSIRHRTYKRQPLHGYTKIARRHHRHGGTVISSQSGARATVAPHAAVKLQCVINYVENAGVRITAIGGYGSGSVRGSRHPHGEALDINQMRRNVTSPHIPASVSNAAADACGVESGARWGWADNGHWNMHHTYYAHRSYGRSRYAYARRHRYARL